MKSLSCEKIGRFVVAEFVEICDELFIALNIGKKLRKKKIGAQRIQKTISY